MKLNQNNPLILMLFLISLFLISACIASETEPNPSTLAASLLSTPDVPPPPPLDLQQVSQGKNLYNQHCASCHGINGEGQANWKIPNEDGSFKPPPHDVTGHTWHHDDDLLFDLIKNGSDFPDTRMPIFKDQLSDEEILATLDYIKTWWGAEERQIQWERTWQVRQQ